MQIITKRYRSHVLEINISPVKIHKKNSIARKIVVYGAEVEKSD